MGGNINNSYSMEHISNSEFTRNENQHKEHLPNVAMQMQMPMQMQMHMHMQMHSTFRLHTTSSMLFQQWPTSTITGLLLAVLATVILSFLFEGLRYYVYVHIAWEQRGQKCSKNATKYRIVSKLTETLLHMLHFATGYILMLAVMTFNMWIFTALILGTTTGYFFVRPTLENHLKVILSNRRNRSMKQRLLQNCTTDIEPITSNIVLNSNYKLTENKDGNSNIMLNDYQETSDLLIPCDSDCSKLAEEHISVV